METKKCETCNGLGLVSSGADKRDLSAGDKLVCTVCTGSGLLTKDGKAYSVSMGGPVDSVPNPKAEALVPVPATGESSGTPSEIVPKEGDACLTDLNKPGKLAKGANGSWTCVADE